MKYFKWFLILGGTLALGWYIFIKQHHHRITFTSNQPIGVFYRHLQDWDQYRDKQWIDSVKIISKTPFSEVIHKVYVKDSLFTYRWKLESTGEQRTKITAYVTDDENSFQQKWEVPFLANSFVKGNIRNVESVGRRMLENSKNFRLSSVTDTLLPETFSAYIELTTTADTKASNMIRNIGTIMGYINDNELKLAGEPFLMVTNWNLDSDEIDYHFCFPIQKSDSLAVAPEIKFKETPSTKALKVIFNGNYRISYQAWYYLKAYAQGRNIDIEGLPTEIFFDDPHSGIDDLKWRADVLMPYK